MTEPDACPQNGAPMALPGSDESAPVDGVDFKLVSRKRRVCFPARTAVARPRARRGSRADLVHFDSEHEADAALSRLQSEALMQSEVHLLVSSLWQYLDLSNGSKEERLRLFNIKRLALERSSSSH